MVKRHALGAAALLAVSFNAGQAWAGPANQYLDQASYYLELAKGSLETSDWVTSSRDKCIWARRALGEYNKAMEYFDLAVQADRNNPEWSASDRAQVGTLQAKMAEQQKKAQKLVKDRC